MTLRFALLMVVIAVLYGLAFIIIVLLLHSAGSTGVVSNSAPGILSDLRQIGLAYLLGL